jgi:hypothetical protein
MKKYKSYKETEEYKRIKQFEKENPISEENKKMLREITEKQDIALKYFKEGHRNGYLDCKEGKKPIFGLWPEIRYKFE